MKNPLRYPGAKSKLYGYIKNLIEIEDKTGCVFYEPFSGSSSLSFKLLKDNIVSKAVINEIDPLIYSFWYSVFNYTDEIISLIWETDVNVENWHKFSKYRDSNFIKNKSVLEIGYAGLFLNRTNFSGILKANPLGGLKQQSKYKIDCRFNKETIIESILDISKLKKTVNVYNYDAIEFMKNQLKYKRNKKSFVYIDPPYYKQGPGLYRFYYTHEDHVELAKYIRKKTFPWLISYDDTLEIRKMYSKKTYINLYLDYSVKTSKKGSELLISNLEIPPVKQKEMLCMDVV